jgi:hypothetical protein
MLFMRYVTVWLLRLVSGKNFPKEQVTHTPCRLYLRAIPRSSLSLYFFRAVSKVRNCCGLLYVTVWLLRLVSGKNFPKEQVTLPLPEQQPEVFKCLPEYRMNSMERACQCSSNNTPCRLYLRAIPRSSLSLYFFRAVSKVRKDGATRERCATYGEYNH